MTRPNRARRAALATAALALGAVCTLAAASAAAPATVPAGPLAGAWVTPAGTWAIVAMGQLDRPNDTFWQLVERPRGAARWSVVTPPGVADNGGLVADDVGSGAMTAGFEPSQYLTYSPVAQSLDAGRTWSPGILPGELADVPQALAPSAAGTGALALVRQAGGTILRSAGSLDTWSTVTTLHALGSTRAGRACGLEAIGAVAEAGGHLLVGGSCAAPGALGLFTLDDGAWSGVPAVVGAIRRARLSVLDLWSGPTGTAGLVEARAGATRTLYALWRVAPGAGWTLSPPLRVGGTPTFAGAGPFPAVVVIAPGHDGSDVASEFEGSHVGWVRLPTVPDGTAALSVATGGGTDALVVRGAQLVDWHLDATTRRWQRTSTLDVHLEYGSST